VTTFRAPGRATTAVILNYRTPSQTIALARSLRRSSAVQRVFVVDNASGDESVTRFKSELEGVDVLTATDNKGFSAGCNVGVREALGKGADRLLLLNPDVVVQANAITVLDEATSGGGDIVGPVLVESADPDRIESAGISYSPATGRMRHRLSGATRSTAQIPAMTDVDAVSGCAMLVRREVFETVGLFAEEYFYGFEDLEFCLRAKAAGFRTVCAGRAVVHHEGAASIGRDSPRRLYFAARNHLLLASRVGSQAWPLRVARATNIVGLNVAHAIVRSQARMVPSLTAIGRGVRDHLKGKYGSDESPPA
jgi:GT2 family glycosyltransferase